jgi:tetratricopeptide (TPR) repeat protein
MLWATGCLVVVAGPASAQDGLAPVQTDTPAAIGTETPAARPAETAPVATRDAVAPPASAAATATEDPAYGRGVELRAAGDLAGAERALDEALARFPGSPPIERELGLVLVGLGRDGDAEPLLQDGVVHEPGDTSAALALADLYLRRPETVAGAYANERGELAAGAVNERSREPEARELLERLSRMTPPDDRVKISLGLLEARAGNLTRAADLLAWVAPVSSYSGVALYDLGLLHLKRGDPRTAVTFLAEAAAVASDRAEPCYALGLAHLRLDDEPAATAAFEAAERRSPGTTGACARQLGHFHEAAGDLEAAATEYRRGARAQVAGPASAGTAAAWADLGRVEMRLGRATEAATSFEASLRAKDDAAVHFERGLALILAGDQDAVRPEIDVLTKTSPDLARRLAELLQAHPAEHGR